MKIYKTETRGKITGYHHDEAVKIVKKRWRIYEKALNLFGDTVAWKDGKSKSDHTKQMVEEFGYFERTESEKYQEIEQTSTITEEVPNYQRECYDTIITDSYSPVTHTETMRELLKVVPKGKKTHVLKLEEEFIKESTDYYEVKRGFSSDLPSKSLSIGYNITFLLASLFLAIFMVFSPTILPTYGQSLSVDIRLFSLINGYTDMITMIPAWVCYVALALFVVGLIAFGVVASKYHDFYEYKLGFRKSFIWFIVALVTFGLGYAMNEWYREFVASHNPLSWIGLALFCLARALCLLAVLIGIIGSIVNLIRSQPHEGICNEITSKANRLNNFINSGKYQKCSDMLEEIKSLKVSVESGKLNELIKVLTKIDEIEEEKNKLINIEKTEFIDQKAEIAECDERLRKAQARVDALVGAKPKVTKSAQ